MKNYYEILDLKFGTSISTINKKHLQLLNSFREKRNQKDYNTNKFVEQSEAYYVLRHAKRKSIYDRLYAIHFSNKAFHHPQLQKKWENMIEKAAIGGRNYGLYLIELSDQELRKVRRKRKGRSLFAIIGEMILTGIDPFPF